MGFRFSVPGSEPSVMPKASLGSAAGPSTNLPNHPLALLLEFFLFSNQKKHIAADLSNPNFPFLKTLTMEVPLAYCVYVLISEKDRLLYIGFTTNISRRLQQHNAGEARSTAPRRPLKLIFTEHYLYESDARYRERYFKTSMGRKALRLMLTSTLAGLGYKGEKFRIEYVEDETETG